MRYGSSCKLPPNMMVEAAIDGSNGSFYFNRQWKLTSTSMDDSTNFHGSKSSSYLLPPKLVGASKEVILPPFTPMQASMDVDGNFHIWK